MKRKVERFGVIGLGNGAKLLRNAGKMLADEGRAVRWVAAYDPSAQARENFCGGTEIVPYDSLDRMLAEAALDAVHIATPSGAHLEACLAAARAGVPLIVCEKPVEITDERIRLLLDGVGQSCSVLRGVFQNRCSEAVSLVASAAMAGRFGKLRQADGKMWWRRESGPGKYYLPDGWRGTWSMDGGGALMNQGIHILDLLCWLSSLITGAPIGDALLVNLRGYIGRLGHEAGTPQAEDEAVLGWEFPGHTAEEQATATFHAATSWVHERPWELKIIGSEGWVEIMQPGLLTRWTFRNSGPEDEAALELISRVDPVPASGLGSDPMGVGTAMHAAYLKRMLLEYAEGAPSMFDGPGVAATPLQICRFYRAAEDRMRVKLPGV